MDRDDGGVDLCTVCAELAGHTPGIVPQARKFQEIHPAGRIVRSSGQWAVMPSLGALTVGHVLLVSKVHVPSVAHLPTNVIKRLAGEIDAVRAALEPHLGPMIFFEHGSMGSGNRSGSCTDHAHAHGLPMSGQRLIELSALPWDSMEALTELRGLADRSQPYLYVQDEKGRHWMTEIRKPLPCQFLRRVAAEIAGCPEQWDWFVYPRYAEMAETVAMFHGRS